MADDPHPAAPAPAPRSSGVAFKTMMATIGTSLLMFFANLIWNSFGENGKAIEQLTQEMTKLKADQARWGLLSDLHNQMILLDRRQALYENDVKWLRWGIEEHVASPTQPTQTTPPSTVPAPPRPAPVAPRPGLKSDEGQKLLDPEELKKFYEQKHQYPNPAQTPKK